MKSFQFPTVGKRPTSKKDLEEQRKKLEEQAAAAAFEEYVAVFQDNSNGAKGSSKVWIKAGTYDAGKRQEDTKDKGKLYKPTSRFETGSSSSKEPTSSSSLSELDSRPDKPGSSKKRQGEKKKSNLEIFKEELKIIQEEREERHRLKRMLGLQEVIKLPPKPGDDLRASLSLELDDIRMIGGSGGGSGGAGSGSIDDGDPNTTNIYLGNLPTKISEQQLMETFGKYGPLASVKVMWPRTEEEKSRNRLSGFVAFMSRRDGERALKNLSGKEILGAEIKLGWGKAVPIPAYPVYIPPCMLELTMPPPLSGLPFNAQVDKRDSHRVKLPPPGTPYPTDPKGKEEFDKLLSAAVVKVVMPTDRQLLCLIHRMVEFVVREGPMFEAMIMNKEIGNPQFRFLFENQSPAHVYYRWKLFSILQGDSTTRWRTEDFRMFMNGSVWRPPKLNPFTQGMPDELIPEEEREIRVGSLSNAQRNRLERMLRKLTPDRHKVAEVMIFCIEHAESASDEISDCIKESLTIESTSLQKKIARLYVLSDVLHNCTAKGMNAFGYRKCFKSLLPGIFQSLRVSYEKHKAGGCKETELESFKQRVMGCFKAWDEVGVFSSEFLIRLQNVFLGLVRVQDEGVDYNDPNKSPSGGGGSRVVGEGVDNEEDDDDDEEVARAKLLDHKSKMFSSRVPKAQMPPQSAMKLVKALQSSGSPEISEELDGVPLFETGGRDNDDEVDRGSSKNPSNASVNKFKPSKWEELDPEQVKAGAVTTTSKWDLFEEQKRKEEAELGKLQGRVREDAVVDDDEDIDGVPMEEDYGGDLGNSESFNENLLESSDQKVSTVDEDLVEDDERRRAKLREVEMKVLAFQDELERRGVVGDGVDLVKEYREKLLRKINNEKGGGSSSSTVQQKKRGSSRKSRRSSSDSFSDDSEGGEDDGSSQEEDSSLDRHGHHAKQSNSSSSRSSRRRSSKRSSNSPPQDSSINRSSSSSQQRHSQQQSSRRHHHRGDRSRSREEASSRRNRSRSPRRYDSKDKDSSKRGSSSRRSRSPRGSSRR